MDPNWMEKELDRLAKRNNICDKCANPSSQITSVVIAAKTQTKTSGGLYNCNLCEKCFKIFSENLDTQGVVSIKEIEKLRDELYNNIPTGEVDAFELIKIIKAHIKKLDYLTYNPEKRPPAGSQIKRGGMS